MRTMDALSIRYNSSLCADRAHARAGDSHASTGIDFACTTTQRVIAIASPHELHGDSWPSSSTGTSSFCCNHQYSITAVTTSTGTIAERYAYSAYGQPTILDASGTVLQTSNFSLRTSYTGREWDATLGLHHFRARWMSPSAGRFLGRDPIGFEGSEWGMYEFVRSRALNRLDPSGLILIYCECRSPSIADLFPFINQGSGWEVPKMCDGLASTCCQRACCPNNFNPCYVFTGRWRVPNTPPPPTFSQVFCDLFTNCSASECRGDCANQGFYLMLAAQARCVAICGRLPGPLQLECMRNCATDAGVFVFSYTVGCLASCQLRCKNP
jgi:RHS repeat-associated protein